MKWLRILLVLLATLLLAPSAHAIIGGYGGENANVGSTSASFSQPSSLTGATLIASPHVAEVAAVYWTGVGAEPTALSIASGWTKIEGQAQGTNLFVDYFRHCYTSGDPAFTLSWTGSTAWSGLIYWVTDAACTSPTSDFHDSGAGTSFQASATSGAFNTVSLTPSVADEDVLYIGYGVALGNNGLGNGTLVFQSDNPFTGINFYGGYIATRGTTATQVGSTNNGSGAVSALYEILITPTSSPQYPKIHGVVLKQQSSTSSPSWTINSAGQQNLWVATGDTILTLLINTGGGWHFTSSSGFNSLSNTRGDNTGTCCSFSGQQVFISTGNSSDTSYSMSLSQSVAIGTEMIALKSSSATPDANAGFGTNTAVTSPSDSALSMTSGLPEWCFTSWTKVSHAEAGWTGTQPDIQPLKSPIGSQAQFGLQIFNTGSGTTPVLTDNYTSGTDFGVWEQIVMANTLSPAPVGGSGLGGGILFPYPTVGAPIGNE